MFEKSTRKQERTDREDAEDIYQTAGRSRRKQGPQKNMLQAAHAPSPSHERGRVAGRGSSGVVVGSPAAAHQHQQRQGQAHSILQNANPPTRSRHMQHLQVRRTRRWTSIKFHTGASLGYLGLAQPFEVWVFPFRDKSPGILDDLDGCWSWSLSADTRDILFGKA